MLNTPFWFRENFEVDKGRNLSVAVTDILEVKQSKFQKIEVFQTVSLGKMLVLDGIIQLTEFDNFAYHEMMAHVPLMIHPNPERVLIVGGGDGGVLKEALKHSCVKEVFLCEIDQDVITVCQKHFPDLSSGYQDPRVTVVIDDAAKFISTKPDYFDVICVDSSDPIGPALSLFNKKFYENISKALTEEGISVSQSESMYFHAEFIASLYKQNKEIFPIVDYYYTLIPTYPSGTIGYAYCSKKYSPQEKLGPKRIRDLENLKYYNVDIHKSAFALPEFLKTKL
jgi:spermidine synthase